MGEKDLLPEDFIGILDRYELQALHIEPYKMVYRVEGRDGFFALKEIKFPEDEFCYIYGAMEHLAAHGFSAINRTIPTRDGYPYALWKGKRYALSRWIGGREADYSRRGDLKTAARTLAALHQASEGYFPPPWEGRIKWGTWQSSMEDKMNQLLDFKHGVRRIKRKNNFDLIFLSSVDYYISECIKALELLDKSAYDQINQKEAARQFFCHHDFAHHNVIIDEHGQGHVIDFDYCISDLRCHDLGSLMLRVLKRSGWDQNQALLALKYYRQVRKVSSKERDVLQSFLRFPQDFWQVAFACYVEQNQSEERLLRKLQTWVLDKPLREKGLHKLAKLI
ncbi:CotS family spore coat protein [Dehalobacterium formicoaceticum]|uniref:CotS family spore coat protein n=1 Tax=Dehalobacterium formicoaceticum TaxID=51515 RepID=UPI0031F6BBD3